MGRAGRLAAALTLLSAGPAAGQELLAIFDDFTGTIAYAAACRDEPPAAPFIAEWRYVAAQAAERLMVLQPGLTLAAAQAMLSERVERVQRQIAAGVEADGCDDRRFARFADLYDTQARRAAPRQPG